MEPMKLLGWQHRNYLGFGAFWSVTMVMIAGAEFMVVAMAVMVVDALFVAVIIIAVSWSISPREPGDVFFMAPIDLFSVSILVGHLEHLAYHC